jgi:hypothetical protein
MTLTTEMATMREQQAVMHTDLQWVKKEQCDQNTKLDSIGEKITTFIETVNTKYATKEEVETINLRTQKLNKVVNKYTTIIGFIVTILTIAINVYF